MNTGRSVVVVHDDIGLTITKSDIDEWSSLDTVIKLEVR